MHSDLIFDVGAHKGEDTAFYLSKGFRVIAIEANPNFCRVIEDRFREAVSDGSLVILNTAIAQHEGTIEFFVNEKKSVWGTTKRDWVDRNRQFGAGQISEIKVSCEPLSNIVAKHGIPYYCKIDIEGADVDALASLSQDEAPQYVSIESTKTSWDDLIDEFRLLRSLGYRRFKVIDQSLVSLQECPNPPSEGRYVDHQFEFDSSGLFGTEAPAGWLTALEAIEAYKNIFRGYALNGDSGLFTGRKSLFHTLAEIQKGLFRIKGVSHYDNPARMLPPVGWYDTHAAK
jgi:FkbM family methyltransferase